MTALVSVLLLAALTFSFNPGDTIPEPPCSELEEYFVSDTLSDAVFSRMQGKSFKEGCTVPRESLRYLRLLHKDKDGNIIIGEMVCHKAIASDILSIFRELYLHSYPVERVRLIDDYGADDESSMRANNSSCFNFRTVAGTNVPSVHGLGLAIDVNPLYNPYWKRRPDGREIVEPANASAYVDRNADFIYKIVRGDLLVRLFLEHGFTWGGDWKSCKDWQHFEKKL